MIILVFRSVSSIIFRIDYDRATRASLLQPSTRVQIAWMSVDPSHEKIAVLFLLTSGVRQDEIGPAAFTVHYVLFLSGQRDTIRIEFM